MNFVRNCKINLHKYRKTHTSYSSNENIKKWSRNTTLRVGDSMLPGIEERVILKRDVKVKGKNFPGVTIDEMYDCIKPLLKRRPDNILLVGTNNTVNETSKVVLGKLVHGLQMHINSR